MKNTEIHFGLQRAEIRDLIAKGFVDCLSEDDNVNNAKFERAAPNVRPTERALNFAKAQLDIAKHNVKVAEKRHAFYLIMKEMGWEEFDVSDETIGDYGTFSLSFIGTKEEYDDLIAFIENDK